MNEKPKLTPERCEELARDYALRAASCRSHDMEHGTDNGTIEAEYSETASALRLAALALRARQSSDELVSLLSGKSTHDERVAAHIRHAEAERLLSAACEEATR